MGSKVALVWSHLLILVLSLAVLDQESFAQEEPRLHGLLEGHKHWVLCFSFSPDSKVLASGSADGSIKIWDVAESKLQTTLQIDPCLPFSLRYSPDGTSLAWSNDKTIVLWDIAKAKVSAVLDRHKNKVLGVAYSPDGKTLASASADGTIRLWDKATGRAKVTLRAKEAHPCAVIYNPNGKMLVSGNSDGTIVFWDVERREQKSLPKGHLSSMQPLAFSPDGRTLATGKWSTIKLWDVTAGKERAAIEDTRLVRCIAFRPDGKTLAVGNGDGTIGLWNVASRKEIVTFNAHLAGLHFLEFSPDGSILASSGGDYLRHFSLTATGV